MPSTDTVQGSSPFDNIKPFNRRKCVGVWTKDPNSAKAMFTVNAYFGDGDYTEDGTNGDYVAIDVEPFYYYQYNGIVAVSEYRYPGFAIHPVCVDADGNIRKHTYIPAYAMAMVDGHPVSLPGYENFRAGYADHIANARKYNNEEAKAYAIIEPAAVTHYEWLLMTIEFATQNMSCGWMDNLENRVAANPGLWLAKAKTVIAEEESARRLDELKRTATDEAICELAGIVSDLMDAVTELAGMIA